MGSPSSPPAPSSPAASSSLRLPGAVLTRATFSPAISAVAPPPRPRPHASAAACAGPRPPARPFSLKSPQKPRDLPVLPTLQQLARQFYRSVHPDLFHVFPHARAHNESALRDFMSAMSKWRQRPNGSPLGRVTKCDLRFFLLPPKHAPSDELTTVDISLPLNGSYDAMYKAVKTLFESCGIMDEFTVASRAASAEHASVESFIAHSVTHAREMAQKGSGAQDKIARVRERLYRAHGIEVQNSEFFSLYTDIENAAVLECFEEAVQRVYEQKPGVVDNALVSFDSPTGGDQLDEESGFLLLNREIRTDNIISEESKMLLVDSWASFIMHNVRGSHFQAGAKRRQVKDQEERRAVQRRRKQLEVLEEKACKVLGVRTIEAASIDEQLLYPLGDDDDEDDVIVSADSQMDQLEKFLKTVTQGYKEIRQNRKHEPKKFRNVSLIVRQLPNQVKSHVLETGTLYLSPHCTVKEVMAALATDGKKAIQNLHETSQWDTMCSVIMARVGLRSVSSHHELHTSRPDFVSLYRGALQKLHDNMDELRSLNLSGLELCVGLEYSVMEDGTLVIPYDFSVEDVRKYLEAGST